LFSCGKESAWTLGLRSRREKEKKPLVPTMRAYTKKDGTSTEADGKKSKHSTGEKEGPGPPGGKLKNRKKILRKMGGKDRGRGKEVQDKRGMGGKRGGMGTPGGKSKGNGKGNWTKRRSTAGGRK